MSFKNNSNKVKLKLIDGDDNDVIYVHPVDAKELLQQGKYTFINNNNNNNINIEQLVEFKESPQLKVQNETSVRDKINSMVSKDIEKILDKRGIKIEGFATMNLKEKREALINSINNDYGDL